MDISWDSQNGWGIGFGFGCQINDLGASASIDVHQNGTIALSVGAGVDASPAGGLGASGGTSLSWNARSGFSFSTNFSACIGGLGFDVGTTQVWGTNGTYAGGIENEGVWAGTLSMHAGVGVQFGWGSMATSTGGYVEMTAFGVEVNHNFDTGQNSVGVSGSIGAGIHVDTDKMDKNGFPVISNNYVDFLGARTTFGVPDIEQVLFDGAVSIGQSVETFAQSVIKNPSDISVIPGGVLSVDAKARSVSTNLGEPNFKLTDSIFAKSLVLLIKDDNMTWQEWASQNGAGVSIGVNGLSFGVNVNASGVATVSLSWNYSFGKSIDPNASTTFEGTTIKYVPPTNFPVFDLQQSQNEWTLVNGLARKYAPSLFEY